MQYRAWQFLLHLSGTITMLYGAFTSWVDDGSFRLQDHTGGALFGFATWLTAVGTFVVIGSSIYTALVYRGRRPPSNPTLAKVAFATAVIATIAVLVAITLVIAVYHWVAPASAPPRELVEAMIDAPPPRSVTVSPWLALEGCTTIAIGALWLWRTERRRT